LERRMVTIVVGLAENSDKGASAYGTIMFYASF
jgi:hypothetical protein